MNGRTSFYPTYETGSIGQKKRKNMTAHTKVHNNKLHKPYVLIEYVSKFHQACQAKSNWSKKSHFLEGFQLISIY